MRRGHESAPSQESKTALAALTDGTKAFGAVGTDRGGLAVGACRLVGAAPALARENTAAPRASPNSGTPRQPPSVELCARRSRARRRSVWKPTHRATHSDADGLRPAALAIGFVTAPPEECAQGRPGTRFTPPARLPAAKRPFQEEETARADSAVSSARSRRLTTVSQSVPTSTNGRQLLTGHSTGTAVPPDGPGDPLGGELRPPSDHFSDHPPNSEYVPTLWDVGGRGVSAAARTSGSDPARNALANAGGGRSTTGLGSAAITGRASTRRRTGLCHALDRPGRLLVGMSEFEGEHYGPFCRLGPDG